MNPLTFFAGLCAVRHQPSSVLSECAIFCL
jgi:hypothetical protein